MREKFRAWVETLETFFLEVVFEERHDFKARLTRGVLFGGSKLFQVGVKLRRPQCRAGIGGEKRIACPAG